MLDSETETCAGRRDNAFGQRVEVVRHASEDACSHIGPIRIAVQLLVGSLAYARARGARFGNESLEALVGQRRVGVERNLLQRALDMRKLRLQPRERFAEHAERFEDSHHISADAAGRTEVNDLHRHIPADAIEPPDPLFDDRRFPWQIEQNQAAAEFEVPPLAASLS